MVPKYGDSILTLLIPKFLSFKIEHCASFLFQTLERKLILSTPTSKFLNSVILSQCRIVCLFMTLLKKYPLPVFTITSNIQEIFILSILGMQTLAVLLSLKATPSDMVSTLLPHLVSKIGMLSLNTSILILFLFPETSLKPALKITFSSYTPPSYTYISLYSSVCPALMAIPQLSYHPAPAPPPFPTPLPLFYFYFLA